MVEWWWEIGYQTISVEIVGETKVELIKNVVDYFSAETTVNEVRWGDATAKKIQYDVLRGIVLSLIHCRYVSPPHWNRRTEGHTVQTRSNMIWTESKIWIVAIRFVDVDHHVGGVADLKRAGRNVSDSFQQDGR